MKTTELMTVTAAQKYRGYTYWVAGSEGKFFGYIQAVPKIINRSEKSFATIAEVESYLIGQIDLACDGKLVGQLVKANGRPPYRVREILYNPQGIAYACGNGNAWRVEDLEKGYTIIEVLVVMAMIGILSAIAAPSFLGFLNNQRVAAANGKVYQLMNEAKSTARLDKTTRTLEFRQNGQLAEYAIYKNGDTPFFQAIADDVTINAITIPIKFDGTISPDNLPSQVEVTKGNLRRCTAMVTLLGAIKQRDGAECDL